MTDRGTGTRTRAQSKIKAETAKARYQERNRGCKAGGHCFGGAVAGDRRASMRGQMRAVKRRDVIHSGPKCLEVRGRGDVTETSRR